MNTDDTEPTYTFVGPPMTVAEFAQGMLNLYEAEKQQHPEAEFERLVTDAYYLFSLEAEGHSKRQEYEKWRDDWLKRAGIAIQGKAEEHT